jgi:capsular polysaccharide biosynthesis protein
LHGAQLNGRGNGAPTSVQSSLGSPMKLAPGWHVETHQEEYLVSPRDLLRTVWRRLWIIALVAFVLAGSVVVYSLTRTPMYEASIKILVGQEQRADVPANLASDVMGLQQLASTVAEVVHTRTVAEAVIRQQDLQATPEEFLENMEVQQVPETQVVEISYRDPDPERAQRVADTIGEVISEQVSEVSTSANAITATVWEAAAVPDSPASPNPVRDGLLAFILGLMVGAGLAFLLEHLVDPWRSPEEAEQISGVPTFGVISEFKAPKGKKVVS